MVGNPCARFSRIFLHAIYKRMRKFHFWKSARAKGHLISQNPKHIPHAGQGTRKKGKGKLQWKTKGISREEGETTEKGKGYKG